MNINRHRAWRRSSSVALSLAVALALASCGDDDDGGSNSEQSDPDDPIVFGIRDYFKPEAEKLIAAYEDEFPGSSVELQLFPSDQDGFRQAVLATRLADDVPDVLATYDTIVEEFANAEITTDMEYLTEGGDGLEFAEAFKEAYRVSGGESDGELHGFPQGADAVVLFYNKDHFAKAGIGEPDESWTWEDMVAAAEKLTVKDGDTTTRWGLTTDYDWGALWNPMLISMGSAPLSDDGTEAQLDTPEAVEVFEMLTRPVIDGVFVPPTVQADVGGEQAAFFNGSASMLLSVRALVPGTRGALKDDWDVASMPLVNGERNVGAGSVGVALTEGASQAAAERFIEWYFSEDGGMKTLAETYAIVPPVVSLYDSPIWRDLPGPPYSNDVFVDAVENGVLSPEISLANRGGFEDAIAAAFERIIIGGDSVEEAMRQADAEATEALAK